MDSNKNAGGERPDQKKEEVQEAVPDNPTAGFSGSDNNGRLTAALAVKTSSNVVSTWGLAPYFFTGNPHSLPPMAQEDYEATRACFGFLIPPVAVLAGPPMQMTVPFPICFAAPAPSGIINQGFSPSTVDNRGYPYAFAPGPSQSLEEPEIKEANQATPTINIQAAVPAGNDSTFIRPMPPKGAKKKTVVRPSRNEKVIPETPSTPYVWNEVDKKRHRAGYKITVGLTCDTYRPPIRPIAMAHRGSRYHTTGNRVGIAAGNADYGADGKMFDVDLGTPDEAQRRIEADNAKLGAAIWKRQNAKLGSRRFSKK